jgi:glycerol-3-phosphate cytidylyltransferase
MKKYDIGVTVSSFDLCHAGHMRMLKDCKNICDYLIVGLQDDPSQLEDIHYRLKTGGKPKNTPIMNLEERREILEGIKYVDEIFIYSTEEDLYNKLAALKYDIRILGSDWKGKKYTGHDLPHNAYFHERNHTFSTSELRERVYKAELKRLQTTSPQKIGRTT